MSQPQWRSAPPSAPPWAGAPNQWGQQPQWGPQVQYAPAPQGMAPPGYRPGYAPPGRPPAPRRSPLGRLLLAVIGLSLLALLGPGAGQRHHRR